MTFSHADLAALASHGMGVAVKAQVELVWGLEQFVFEQARGNRPELAVAVGRHSDAMPGQPGPRHHQHRALLRLWRRCGQASRGLHDMPSAGAVGHGQNNLHDQGTLDGRVEVGGSNCRRVKRTETSCRLTKARACMSKSVRVSKP